MYFPYLRGKQEEVIALREVADIIGQSSVIPIVEPVKSTASTIRRLSDVASSIITNGGQIIVIINPRVGELRNNNVPLVQMINSDFASDTNFLLGLIVDDATPLVTIQNTINTYGATRIAVIHRAVSNIPNLANICAGVAFNIFVSGRVGNVYINQFQTPKVLLRDGFERLNNADYTPDTFFSNLAQTFSQDGFNGFGDFQMVGNLFRDGGGAAYAVALHLSYFLSLSSNEMHMKHFISTSNSSPQNPGGKFGEALNALIAHFVSPQNVLEATRGMAEYQDLHRTGHYPGLGRPKRLSIMHHIEIMANRFP